jgi:hypothetical protein
MEPKTLKYLRSLVEMLDARRHKVRIVYPCGPSGVMVVEFTSVADGIDSMTSGDRCAGGLAECAAQDAVDANHGEEPDRTTEVFIIQIAARHHSSKDTEEQDLKNVVNEFDGGDRECPRL